MVDKIVVAVAAACCNIRIVEKRSCEPARIDHPFDWAFARHHGGTPIHHPLDGELIESVVLRCSTGRSTQVPSSPQQGQERGVEQARLEQTGHCTDERMDLVPKFIDAPRERESIGP